MADFNFYVNRQGIRGRKGEKGEQGFSPIISVKTQTANEYVLTVQNEDGSFDTPNLRGNAIENNGGNYVRYNPVTEEMYTGFADYASNENAGVVLLSNYEQLVAGGAEGIVPSSEDVYNFVNAKISETGAFNFDKLASTLISGSNITLDVDDENETITINSSTDMTDVPSLSGNNTYTGVQTYYTRSGSESNTIHEAIRIVNYNNDAILIGRNGQGQSLIGTSGNQRLRIGTDAANYSAVDFYQLSTTSFPSVVIAGVSSDNINTGDDTQANHYPLFNELNFVAGTRISISHTGTGDGKHYTISASGITSSDVTSALGYTPYNSTNPNGYQANVIEAIEVNNVAQTITSKTVNITIPTDTGDLTNNAGFITGITSGDVTGALGYTPYSDSNPNGYTSNVGTVTSVNSTSPDVNGDVTIAIPTVNDATLTINQGGVQKGTFTANASSDTTINLDGNQRNIGEIVTSTIPLTDAGLRLLDGSLILGSGSYSDFVDYIADLYDSGNYTAIFETEANWQTAVTTYGVCGKFVYDSVNNTVRLPKITGIIEGTTDLTALGDLVEAGLPNIIGTANTGDRRTHWGGTGSFYSTTYGSNNWLSTGSTAGGTEALGFDASRSSSIYGNSNTVQPQTIKVLYYIVVATSTKTDIQVDIDEIATDLNGKADVDLSNVSATGKANVTSWVIPDWDNAYDNSRQVLNNTNFTAPSDGVVIGRVCDSTSASSYAYVYNQLGNLIYQYQYGHAGNTNLQSDVYIPLRKGYSVKIVSSASEFYSCDVSGTQKQYGIFVPLEGVN